MAGVGSASTDVYETKEIFLVLYDQCAYLHQVKKFVSEDNLSFPCYGAVPKNIVIYYQKNESSEITFYENFFYKEDTISVQEPKEGIYSCEFQLSEIVPTFYYVMKLNEKFRCKELELFINIQSNIEMSIPQTFVMTGGKNIGDSSQMVEFEQLEFSKNASYDFKLSNYPIFDPKDGKQTVDGIRISHLFQIANIVSSNREEVKAKMMLRFSSGKKMLPSGDVRIVTTSRIPRQLGQTFFNGTNQGETGEIIFTDSCKVKGYFTLSKTEKEILKLEGVVINNTDYIPDVYIYFKTNKSYFIKGADLLTTHCDTYRLRPILPKIKDKEDSKKIKISIEFQSENFKVLENEDD